jgi:hypothetical protein
MNNVIRKVEKNVFRSCMFGKVCSINMLSMYHNLLYYVGLF